MSKSLSVFLDALRFGAALAVVYGHFTLFTVGWKDLHTTLAAVAIFFVMSGFVIFETAPRHPTFRSYCVARLSRMYSVAVPASVLAIAVVVILSRVNPAAFRSLGAECNLPVLRLLASLTFTNQFWALGLDVPGDAPFWSLGYEVPYYLLFGLAYYLRGEWRVAAILIACLFLGPQILLLLPVWALGAGLAYFLNRHRLSPKWAPILLVGAALVFVGTPRFAQIGDQLAHDSRLLSALFFGRSRFFSYFPVGLGTCLIVAAVKALETQLNGFATLIQRPIRLAAGSTFSLYLFHIPLLLLITGIVKLDRANVPTGLGLLAFVCALCFLLSRFTEAKKVLWKRLLERAIPTGAEPI